MTNNVVNILGIRKIAARLTKEDWWLRGYCAECPDCDNEIELLKDDDGNWYPVLVHGEFCEKTLPFDPSKVIIPDPDSPYYAWDRYLPNPPGSERRGDES
jgi:hypothetical protein